ncbi:iron-containing alcohol dehydrogenase [Paucibacter sp. KBW04]|nr:iron-containing alcohol dehydrogenase [Paucibacter sp. KBW04]
MRSWLTHAYIALAIDDGAILFNPVEADRSELQPLLKGAWQ